MSQFQINQETELIKFSFEISKGKFFFNQNENEPLNVYMSNLVSHLKRVQSEMRLYSDFVIIKNLIKRIETVH